MVEYEDDAKILLRYMSIAKEDSECFIAYTITTFLNYSFPHEETYVGQLLEICDSLKENTSAVSLPIFR